MQNGVSTRPFAKRNTNNNNNNNDQPFSRHTILLALFIGIAEKRASMLVEHKFARRDNANKTHNVERFRDVVDSICTYIY